MEVPQPDKIDEFLDALKKEKNKTPQGRLISHFSNNKETEFTFTQLEAIFSDIKRGLLYYHLRKLTEQCVIYKLDNKRGWKLYHAYISIEKKREMVAEHLEGGKSNLVITKSNGSGMFPSATSHIENLELKEEEQKKNYTYFNRHVQSIIERMENCNVFSISDVEVIRELQVAIEQY